MEPVQRDYLEKARQAADVLIQLSEEGEAGSRDNGCALVFGVVRDCGYRIRKEVERESRVHRERQLGEALRQTAPPRGARGPSSAST